MRQNEAGRRKVEAPASECQTSGLRDEHVESCHPFQLPRSIPAERSHPHDELWRPEAGPVFLRREATCVDPTKLGSLNLSDHLLLRCCYARKCTVSSEEEDVGDIVMVTVAKQFILTTLRGSDGRVRS
jgi:hypothetical protein